MDVEALALADKWSTISGKIEDLLLTDLPDGFVDGFDIVRNIRNVLDGAIVGDNHILHVVVPETETNQLTEKPRAHDLEFTSKDPTSIDVTGIC